MLDEVGGLSEVLKDQAREGNEGEADLQPVKHKSKDEQIADIFLPQFTNSQYCMK